MTDLRIMWDNHHLEQESLFLDIPYIGMTPFMEYLRRTVPPRLAKVEDISEATGILSFVGPEAERTVNQFLLGSSECQAELNDLSPGDYVIANSLNIGGGDFRIVRMEDVSGGGWDVYSSRENIKDLWLQLTGAGVQALGASVWEILRVEAGVAAFGQDVCDSNILPETGLVDRAVDHKIYKEVGGEIDHHHQYFHIGFKVKQAFIHILPCI